MMRRAAFVALCVVGALSCGDPSSPPPAVPVRTVTLAGGLSALGSIGDTTRFRAIAKDSAGNVLLGRRVTWGSSDEAVAIVDTGGLVRSIANGTATVSALVEGVAGQTTVLVKQTAASIDVTPASAQFASLGDTVRFTAVAKDALGNVIPKVAWASTNTAIVRIDSTGLATAIQNGTATIVVAAGSTRQITATVSQVPIALEVSPKTYSYRSLKESFRFIATLRDARGNVVTNKAVAWTSADPTIVSVGTTTGIATSAKDGATVLRVGFDSFADSVTASVTQTFFDFAVLPAKAKGWVGAQLELVATPRDSLGNFMPAIGTVVWSSSDPSIASVAADGRVTVIGAGSVRISATNGGRSGGSDLTLRATMGDSVNANMILPRGVYHVTSNVVVANGARLRINPGVTMQFDASAGMTVNGTLLAIGALGDSIRFTSSKAQPAPADWLGLHFELESAARPKVASDFAYLSGTVVSFAEIGYSRPHSFGGFSPFFSHNRVHHVALVGNDAPGAISSCAGGLILENVIEDNATSGLRIGGGALIRRNVIRRNTLTNNTGVGSNSWGGGIAISGTGCESYSADGVPVIEDNTIVGNRGGFSAPGSRSPVARPSFGTTTSGITSSARTTGRRSPS